MKYLNFRSVFFGLVALACLGAALFMLYDEFQDREAARHVEQARIAFEQAIPFGPEHRPLRSFFRQPPPPPLPDETREVRPHFLALIEEFGNEDIIGYIHIEGTSISYPVVQSRDNFDYLYVNLFGEPDPAGAIFMDYENNINVPDRNVILYGHNMRTDTRFHAMRHFRSYNFFRRHPTIRFDTLYEDQEWEIFAFYSTHIRFPYTTVHFDNDALFYALIEQIKARSIYDTGVQVQPGDRILTLSTCTNTDPDTRYVLHARLIRPEEQP